MLVTLCAHLCSPTLSTKLTADEMALLERIEMARRVIAVRQPFLQLADDRLRLVLNDKMDRPPGESVKVQSLCRQPPVEGVNPSGQIDFSELDN